MNSKFKLERTDRDAGNPIRSRKSSKMASKWIWYFADVVQAEIRSNRNRTVNLIFLVSSWFPNRWEQTFGLKFCIGFVLSLYITWSSVFWLTNDESAPESTIEPRIVSCICEIFLYGGTWFVFAQFSQSMWKSPVWPFSLDAVFSRVAQGYIPILRGT